MKKQELIPIPDPTIEPGMAELTVDLGGHPFVIRDAEDTLTALATQMLEDERTAPKQVRVPQAVIERPVPAVQAKTEYLNLGTLNEREIARMSLRAFKYDLVTFGRDNKYRRFKERVAEEKDLSMDMELGLVQRVHCRLHEKLLASK